MTDFDVTETGAQRRCIVSGVVAGREALIRFVVSPANEILPDIHARCPGRGIWVSATRASLEQALKSRSFAKAARAPVGVSQNLVQEVEALLVRQALNILGLALKAGAVTLGFVKAQDLISRGRALALLQASDAAPNGVEKLGTGARQADIPVIALFSASELGLALGRENVVHAALSKDRLARRVLEEARRLAGFRPGWAGIDTSASVPASQSLSVSESEVSG